VYGGSLPRQTLPTGRVAEEDSAIPLGARLAGGFLVVNAIAVLLETALMRGSAPGGGVPGALGSSIIDIVLGVGLLAGAQKVLTLSRIRVALGLLVFPIILLALGQGFQAGFQVVFSGGLLLLLVGRAGVARMALGGATVGLFLALEGVGLLGLAVGQDFLSGLMMMGQLEPGVVSQIEGDDARYRLPLPGEGWRLRKPEAARKDNPLADRWAIWPSKSAHVMVIAEDVPPGGRVDMDQFQAAVVANARQMDPGVTVLDQSEEWASGHLVRLFYTRATAEGIQLRFVYGLHVADSRIFQVITFLPESNADEPTLTQLRQCALGLQPI